ncbi:hypothetical protein PIB30_078782 [Stylosanthes scabra]|uniref:Uncharacterized protein n=1 Tax=Stylosanthes scabra TaxID=79078 RepID=A0ABU6TQI8_9FABA|nr:hypothetical protein [Stylosanthes scabra]
MTDASSGWALMNKTPEEAWELIETVANANQHFNTRATLGPTVKVYTRNLPTNNPNLNCLLQVHCHHISYQIPREESMLFIVKGAMRRKMRMKSRKRKESEEKSDEDKEEESENESNDDEEEEEPDDDEEDESESEEDEEHKIYNKQRTFFIATLFNNMMIEEEIFVKCNDHGPCLVNCKIKGVEVRRITIPTDFHVIEPKKGERGGRPQVLLGRPFLKTAEFKLIYYDEIFIFSVGNANEIFRIIPPPKPHKKGIHQLQIDKGKVWERSSKERKKVVARVKEK